MEEDVKISQDISIDLSEFKLTDTDKAVLQLKLEYPSIPDRELARKINISSEHFCRITKKPAFKKVYNLYLQKPLEIIIEAKTEAAIVLKQLLKDKNPNVKLNAAKEILGDSLSEKNNPNDKPLNVIVKFE